MAMTNARRVDDLDCPRCAHRLRRTTRGSVEVDVCGGCGGVWLDHGELEALNQRAILLDAYTRDLAEDGDLDLLPRAQRSRSRSP